MKILGFKRFELITFKLPCSWKQVCSCLCISHIHILYITVGFFDGGYEKYDNNNGGYIYIILIKKYKKIW